MSTANFKHEERYNYLHGFGSYHETEAIKGALPVGHNSPQKPAYGLYAEKFSGTSFTAPRHENLQSWLYRILPAAAHQAFEPIPESEHPYGLSGSDVQQIPNQLRWDPFDFDENVDWIRGLHLVAEAGDPVMKSGLAIFVFTAGKDMPETEAFYSADGDFLIVPQHGVLDIQTELGQILVQANEICVIPRGIRYRVTLPSGSGRGYICELYQGHFQLPELGPIGSNGLANPRDFQIPIASYTHDTTTEWHMVTKFNKRLFRARQSHSPFDVVAWHGTYYPYKYDLGRFNTIGSISYDHPDPSIFTVLTGPSDHHGTAIADFVIFPPRWLVAEDTFRPPYFHRNTMSEFMGLIAGDYDAKVGGGFRPAGASLHNIMSAHGPDAKTHPGASEAELKPQKVGEGSLAFMFESCLMLGVTEWGLKHCEKVQVKYNKESWEPLRSHFCPPPAAAAAEEEEEEEEGK
ncbi:putative homogentisatedioxygenase [Phaeomoniella chlamydospora]|uniref:homogentisate 1,2-dioxygenase n=1 Tax=Phaeomoniella chlamydospora TaxID=158046 RepID=A0A0G2E6X5_PHACM|nr:putative homogentisatedioxygenase [Phaeomoniella chlamydospora]